MVDALPALRLPDVVAVLDRLHAASAHEDGLARERVRVRESQLGRRLPQEQRYDLYGDAPLAIQREVGELLYLLALGEPNRHVVEFGASHGVSTVYLAAALRDSGGGLLVTTERITTKAERLRRNLLDAGLDDLVEVRVGDALLTLDSFAQGIDFLFLDGSNDLYLAILGLLEPCLESRALIVADLSADDPDLLPYLDYVRDDCNGYVSIEVPLAAGVEVSARMVGDAR